MTCSVWTDFKYWNWAWEGVNSWLANQDYYFFSSLAFKLYLVTVQLILTRVLPTSLLSFPPFLPTSSDCWPKWYKVDLIRLRQKGWISKKNTVYPRVLCATHHLPVGLQSTDQFLPAYCPLNQKGYSPSDCAILTNLELEVHVCNCVLVCAGAKWGGCWPLCYQIVQAHLGLHQHRRCPFPVKPELRVDAGDSLSKKWARNIKQIKRCEWPYGELQASKDRTLRDLKKRKEKATLFLQI